jgi:CO/xanthine dehydrogenase Mo-binding subunit
MTARHLIQVRSEAAPVATAVSEVVRPQQPQVKALRFAVSLTSPQGTEVFRKQFGSPAEADGFARATAELCPDYKVSSVDRLEGFAYELKGQELTITASPARGRGIGKETIRESRI